MPDTDARTLPTNRTFDEQDWNILAQYWYPVARIADLGDPPQAVILLDQPLVVYRAGDDIVVADDLCPHRGVPLSAGTGDGASVTCAYHGLRFGAGGTCIAVPAHPQSKIPARMHLHSYPVAQRYGLVWVCLRPSPEAADDPERAPIPVMPHWEDPGFQCLTCPAFDLAAFAGRQVEGFLDVAHFGFVHRETFGDLNDTVVPDYRPVPTEHGFTVDYWSTHTNYGHDDPRTAPGFQWLRQFSVYLPFTATLIVHFPEGGQLCIMNAASPVSARRTRMFAPIAKNVDTDQPASEVYSFNLRVFEEDRAIVEIQKPENLPLDPRIEVNIAADRSSVAYRRGLRGLGLSTFFTA
jgi:vanillate O-demethylase monooxygenase subunit